MLKSRHAILKPLLESKNGLHLTAYLSNNGNLIEVKSQLRSIIADATVWLNSVLTADEQEKFLEPLESLLHDARIFNQMKGNIGLFRNEESFRLLSIPVEIKQTCQVATSFHVKPLLRWLQSEKEFLLLGLENNSAHLYFGNQESFKIMDSILFPEIQKKPDSVSGYQSLKMARKEQDKLEETYVWLNEWIIELTKNSMPILFIAGEGSQLENFKKKLKYPPAMTTAIANSFDKNAVNELYARIRKTLKEASKKSIENALLEFRFAEEENRARKNIFQISKAAVKGRVRKLIIADELNIYGKVDERSGGLAIHPFDIDHEDDDILDDLAQIVLRQGGEVLVAKQDDIPKGRPILAILDDDGKEVGKADESLQTNAIQARTG